ncbi:hypothetical protein NN561_007142 [Cricetulus griseus]
MRSLGPRGSGGRGRQRPLQRAARRLEARGPPAICSALERRRPAGGDRGALATPLADFALAAAPRAAHAGTECQCVPSVLLGSGSLAQ